MLIKIGINGFGRIGKMILKESLHRKNIKIIAINDLFNINNIFYSLKYDSTHGKNKLPIFIENNKIIYNNNIIHCISKKNILDIDWKSLGVSVVIESSGICLNEQIANNHIISGAELVILTAPPKDNIPIYVMGVNHKKYNKEKILSNASCTTNCLAPIIKIINDNLKIKSCVFSTVHSITSTQKIIDCNSLNMSYGRSGLQNIIPYTTGADKSINKIIPELNGKIKGICYRVPVANVSLLDLNINIDKKINYNILCDLIIKNIKNKYNNILSYTMEDLVSSDIIGEKFSGIIDLKKSICVTEKLIKIVAWYDNEVGYSNRILDLITYIINLKKI